MIISCRARSSGAEPRAPTQPYVAMADGAIALPKKENDLFQQLVRCYETKTYKKGIKAADAILKKFPNHGETLSMKGLLLSCMDKREEAHELVKLGLKNDVKSHVCWHVYGCVLVPSHNPSPREIFRRRLSAIGAPPPPPSRQPSRDLPRTPTRADRPATTSPPSLPRSQSLLHRTDRNYKEAIKCYRMALRIDTGNTQLLRDLSSLQMQIRELADFVESRRQLLTMRPNTRVNWMAFCVGHFYKGDHDAALKVMDEFESSRANAAGLEGDDPKTAKFEQSEMHMFRAMILEEAGRREEALEVLEKRAEEIVDAVGKTEQRARLHAALAEETTGDASESHRARAERLYLDLVARMPDNHRWHHALRRVMGLGAGDVESLVTLYASLREKFPKSDTVARLPLDFLAGDAFVAAAREYVEKPIRKGVPSLFRNLKALYADSAKASALGDIFRSIVDSLESSRKFPGASSEEPEPERCRAYALTLLAHHKEKTGDLEGAIATIDAAIAIEPIIECRLARASFLKRAGDHAGAAAEADVARAADLADRFLNGVCAKRQLQAGDHAGAEKTAAMFARDGDAASNLYEMQCSWFENEAGDCHRRAGNVARSLKYYVSVTKHYDDMEEDQFDFHGYCMRKMTLRMYVDMLRAEDSLYDRPAFRRAAKGAIETYARLHDEPYASAEAKEEEMLAKMTKEERQKYRKKQKQAAERAEREAAERKAAEEAAAKDGKKKPGLPKKPDPDPLGETLAATKTPLDDADEILAKLIAHASAREETHLLAYQIRRRQGRLVDAMRAVESASSVSPGSFLARRDAVELAALVAAGGEALAGVSAEDRDVLEKGVAALVGGKTAKEAVEAVLTEAKRPAECAAAAEAARAAGADVAAAASRAARSAIVDGATAKECIAAAETFEAIDEAAAAAFRARARVAFPRCAAFAP